MTKNTKQTTPIINGLAVGFGVASLITSIAVIAYFLTIGGWAVFLLVFAAPLLLALFIATPLFGILALKSDRRRGWFAIIATIILGISVTILPPILSVLSPSYS